MSKSTNAEPPEPPDGLIKAVSTSSNAKLARSSARSSPDLVVDCSLEPLVPGWPPGDLRAVRRYERRRARREAHGEALCTVAGALRVSAAR